MAWGCCPSRLTLQPDRCTPCKPLFRPVSTVGTSSEPLRVLRNLEVSTSSAFGMEQPDWKESSQSCQIRAEFENVRVNVMAKQRYAHCHQGIGPTYVTSSGSAMVPLVMFLWVGVFLPTISKSGKMYFRTEWNLQRPEGIPMSGWEGFQELVESVPMDLTLGV